MYCHDQMLCIVYWMRSKNIRHVHKNYFLTFDISCERDMIRTRFQLNVRTFETN